MAEYKQSSYDASQAAVYAVVIQKKRPIECPYDNGGNGADRNSELQFLDESYHFSICVDHYPRLVE